MENVFLINLRLWFNKLRLALNLLALVLLVVADAGQTILPATPAKRPGWSAAPHRLKNSEASGLDSASPRASCTPVKKTEDPVKKLLDVCT